MKTETTTRLPANTLELGRRQRAEAAHRLAKAAMTKAAAAAVTGSPDAVQLGERALTLLRRADSLEQLAAQAENPGGEGKTFT